MPSSWRSSVTDTAQAAGLLRAGTSTEGTDMVSIAYCHENQVAYSWHHSMLQLLVNDLVDKRRVQRAGIIAIRCNAGQLVSARNKAVRLFLEEGGSQWLLWVDTDMAFAPDTLERLLEVADPVERPIVGALCFSQREMAPDDMGGYHTAATPTIFDWISVTDDTRELEGFEIRYDYPPNALVRCDGTGSALILVHRSVFERIQAKYGREWYHRIPARDGSMGEDLSFCMRATALGFPIYVHTGVRTTHLKPVWLTEQDFLEQSSAPPAAEEVAVLVPVLGRPEHAAPFMTSLRASSGLATVYAVHDRDDEETAAAWKQHGAVLIDVNDHLQLDRPGRFSEKVNVGFRYSAEPWVLLVGSDVRFHAGWLDHALLVAGDRYHVVGTNDLGNPRVLNGQHATHLLIRRSYVTEHGASWDGPGIVVHEGYGHAFCDDEIVAVAKERGVWTMALASKIEHLHPMWGKAPMDPVYALGQTNTAADAKRFQERLAEHGTHPS